MFLSASLKESISRPVFLKLENHVKIKPMTPRRKTPPNATSTLIFSGLMPGINLSFYVKNGTNQHTIRQLKKVKLKKSIESIQYNPFLKCAALFPLLFLNFHNLFYTPFLIFQNCSNHLKNIGHFFHIFRF